MSLKLYIGTSGWSYWHWKGKFYPEKLSSKSQLKYYSKYFKTVEINSSFYHLPRAKTYQNWASQVSDDFVFAVKASRFITHIKRLKGVKLAWKRFVGNTINLGNKLGPILFQFPSSFQANPINIKRLEKLLVYIKRNWPGLKLAFEFRHKSWFDKKIYKILKKYKTSLVIADSSRYPKDIVSTTDFVYFRYHGPAELFGSKYSEKQLQQEAKIIRKFLNQKKEVYVYFNNDFSGYAIENAKELIKILR